MNEMYVLVIYYNRKYRVGLYILRYFIVETSPKSQIYIDTEWASKI